MTPNEAIRRITQRAMERHRLSQRGLAHEIGCGEGSIAKILDEQEVRLTQEQWFYLMTLGNIPLPSYFTPLEREFSILICKLRKLLLLIISILSIGPRISFGVPEVDIVCNDLSTPAFVAVLVRPVTELKAAIYHGHATFCEVAADKLAGLPPSYHINEIGSAVSSSLVLKVPVHRQSEGGHSRSGLGVPELWISGQTSHNSDMVKHFYSPICIRHS